MIKLKGQDAAFLYAETPNWHMHISGLMVVDPSDAPDFSFERVRELLVSRIPDIPQLRWRYLDVPFGVDRPSWIEDPDLDPDFHIRRIGVPSPGGREEMGQLVGQLASLKLDRSRPLWETWIIEGLEGDKIAILTKMHHAIVDGVSGAGLAEVLLDVDPEPRPASTEPTEPIAPERIPGPPELFVRGLATTAVRTPFRLARFARQTINQLVATAPVLRGETAVTLPLTAPRTTLNTDPTPHRRFAAAQVSLDRAKAVKAAHGVKLNDVVLALCSTALRRYLLEIDDLPADPLVAQCPVSLRVEGDDEVGNKVGSMFAGLATDLEDPVERLEAIHASTQGAKEMREALSAHQIMGLTETTPPGLIALAARMYTLGNIAAHAPPAVNVVISNVPGPPFPLYVAGAKLEAMYPMGPLLFGMSLNITVFSLNGMLDFGFMSCPESVPHPEMIADGIEIGLDELESAA
jgi:WS/DGAT/MGAT family acyltransferase